MTDQYFPSLKNLTWTAQDQQNVINSAYMNGLGLMSPITALTSGLFGYLTNGQYYDSLINHSPRVAGTIQVAGGLVSLGVAAAAGAIGIGAPLSAVMGFVAIDNIQAGARAIYSNQETSTYGAELITWSGLVPEKYSEIAYGLFDISLAGKASLALKTASQSHNIVKFSTIKTSGQIKPTDMRVTIVNISLNRRNVIELKEPTFNPYGSLSAAKLWTISARLKYARLPTKGKIRFVPDKNYLPNESLGRGKNYGYFDRFENEWTKGPSRTKGQEFEWDVILSEKGKAQLG